MSNFRKSMIYWQNHNKFRQELIFISQIHSSSNLTTKLTKPQTKTFQRCFWKTWIILKSKIVPTKTCLQMLTNKTDSPIPNEKVHFCVKCFETSPVCPPSFHHCSSKILLIWNKTLKICLKILSKTSLSSVKTLPQSWIKLSNKFRLKSSNLHLKKSKTV